MYQRIFNPGICRILFASFLSALCLIALSTQAATITVTNTNDSGAGSLRAALTSAANGDTIDATGMSGAILLTSGELFVDKSVTINGPGAANLAVDGNHSDRVFQVANPVTVTISGLTITNGSVVSSDVGGGIYNDGSTLTVSDCAIVANFASFGGGIYNGHSTLTVNNCTLSGNSAGVGGGIYNAGSNSGSATLTINNSTLSGNSGGIGGGGIYNDGTFGSATLTISDSTLSGSSAGFFAGGIYNNGEGGSAMLTISNSTLSGNSVSGGVGGGIFNDGRDGSAMLTISNSTLSGNSAGFFGSIYNYGVSGSATLTIGDTILNAGASGENIFNNSGTVTSHGYNLSSDNGGGLLTATGDQINTDPLLGPLQDNGGPTFTHELLNGSPAIDAGKNFTAGTTDQRGPGFVRTFDSASIANANGGDGTDIGAFEVQPVTPSYAGQVQPPINPDGTSTFNVRRGVVPVKFNLTQGGVATCDLPPATIAVTRTAGGVVGQVNESVYSGNADTGSNFRIDSCQYVYNLNSRALGAGTYRVDILIDGQVVGTAVFALN